MIIDNDGRILYDRHKLSSRYWEPQPDEIEEDYFEKIWKDFEENYTSDYNNEELPFN